MWNRSGLGEDRSDGSGGGGGGLGLANRGSEGLGLVDGGEVAANRYGRRGAEHIVGIATENIIVSTGGGGIGRSEDIALITTE